MAGLPGPRQGVAIGWTLHGVVQGLAWMVALDAGARTGDGSFQPSLFFVPATIASVVVPFLLGLVVDLRRDTQPAPRRWPDRLGVIGLVTAACVAHELAGRADGPGRAFLFGLFVGALVERALWATLALGRAGLDMLRRRHDRPVFAWASERDDGLHRSAAREGDRDPVLVSDVPLPQGVIWIDAAPSPSGSYRSAPVVRVRAFEADEERRSRRERALTALLILLALASWLTLPLLHDLGPLLGERTASL